MNVVNIISGGLATRLIELLKELPSDQHVVRKSLAGDNYHGMARWCERGGKRTGGVVVEVRGREPKWSAVSRGWAAYGRAPIAQRRLPPGASERRIYMAICRCVNEVRVKNNLNRAKDVLWEEVRRRVIDYDELQKMAKEYGRSDTYAKMSQEDVEFWHKWVMTQPVKP